MALLNYFSRTIVLKNQLLPSVTPSGIFRSRRLENLVQHSGYLCIDIDGLKEIELSEVKDSLVNDAHIKTVLLFTSPSKCGIKWFIKIPPNHLTHGDYFDAVENYLKANYSYEIDKCCRDVSRACFLSSDQDAYLNPDLDFNPLDEEFLKQWQPKKDIKKSSKVENVDIIEKIQNVKELVKVIRDQSVDITDDYNNWLNIGFALCELGEDGRSFFHQISRLSDKYKEVEADEKYTHLLETYDGRIKLGTLFHISRELGIHLSSSPADTSNKSINPMMPRTASQRLIEAKNQEPIKKLLGSIWYTGELHILFGDNGTGKSVWATQIADALSKGKKVFNILPNENPALKVLFYDFELSDKQFEKRYHNGTGQHYIFSDLLHIDNINFQLLSDANPKMGTDELIINKIESDIKMLEPKVVIIDNMTYLKTETTQEAKVALELIRKLNQLKRKYNLSILVISHTPKIKGGMPISNNDLAGSKNLSNLVDSISAVGKSNRSNDEKYIKLIKCRTDENIFHTDNVISVRIQKEDCFLGFEYLDCENEYEHIKDYQKEKARAERDELKAKAKSLYAEGKSLREIAVILGVGKSTVERWNKD